MKLRMEEEAMQKSNRTAAKTANPVSTSVVSKNQAERFLAKVPEENVFWCNGGCVIRDMEDLKDALAAMTDQTFAFHSNEVKKDFSNWVREVIGDEKLAKDLEKASNREQAARIAEERYTILKNVLKKP
jgi:hypothetical protein